MIAIGHALADDKLLGAALGPIETWETWLAVLKAAFADELTPDEQKAFESVSGGRTAATSLATKIRSAYELLRCRYRKDTSCYGVGQKDR